MNNSLGDRMKNYYEDRFRNHLPRRNNAIIRVDGKAFHTFTRGMKRPYDEGFMEDMNLTAVHLCENIQGAKMGYVQSDEISIWLTDYDDQQTDAWFDYNIQKMCSIAASLATAKFNYLRLLRYFSGNWDNIAVEKDQTIGEHFAPGTNLEKVRDDIASFINYMPLKPKHAMFDARVFSISTLEEVVNYFIWRQQDATRNSIAMAAQSHYSHKELNKKNSDEQQEMLFQKGINWNDYPTRFKRGAAVVKRTSDWAIEMDSSTGKPKGKPFEALERNKWKITESHRVFQRSTWEAVETPIFTKEKNFITDLSPKE